MMIKIMAHWSRNEMKCPLSCVKKGIYALSWAKVDLTLICIWADNNDNKTNLLHASLINLSSSHFTHWLTCDGVSPPLLLSFIRPCEYKTLIFHYISSMCLCMDIIYDTEQKARFFSQIYGVRTNSPQLFSPLTQRCVSMTVKLFGTKKSHNLKVLIPCEFNQN